MLRCASPLFFLRDGILYYAYDYTTILFSLLCHPRNVMYVLYSALCMCSAYQRVCLQMYLPCRILEIQNSNLQPQFTDDDTEMIKYICSSRGVDNYLSQRMLPKIFYLLIERVAFILYLLYFIYVGVCVCVSVCANENRKQTPKMSQQKSNLKIISVILHPKFCFPYERIKNYMGILSSLLCTF